MALAKKCDACGKLYENYTTEVFGTHVNSVYFCTKRADGTLDINGEWLDLCQDCLEKVVLICAPEEDFRPHICFVEKQNDHGGGK